MQEYGELQERMTRVETKLDLVLGQLTGTHQDHEIRIRGLEQRVDPTSGDHEFRIRKLERVMWIVAGAAATGGGAVGSLVASLIGS